MLSVATATLATNALPARLNPGVVQTFCWAHVRRDFLALANSHPQSAEWALQWVAMVGQIYHLNGLRLFKPAVFIHVRALARVINRIANA